MQITQQPLVYEIHTAAFLQRLSTLHDRVIKLANVPDEEWDKLADLGVDMVWLMGVWQRSPAGTRLSIADETFLPGLRETIPGLQIRDVIGSAYCVKEYVVDEVFGGAAGLATARQALAERGIGLMLDFVPNHTAPDHSWVSQHPEYFITGDMTDFKKDSKSFLHIGSHVLARGRDPHYAAWPDVVQLNAFSDGYRQAAVETLQSIASQSDAVRCDMAMLMFGDIFAKNWGERAGKKPEQEFWANVIHEVRVAHPDFIFLAESYWDSERELIKQGFDYCYDKTLYDLFLEGSPNQIHDYLEKLSDSQATFCRFIENHDEPRAAAVFPPETARAVATAIATLPGMRLLHAGQMEGFRVKIPVHVDKGPFEATDSELQNFYKMLFEAVKTWQRQAYTWHLWHLDNKNILAWEWRHNDRRHIVIINYSKHVQHTPMQIDTPGSLTNALTMKITETDAEGKFSLDLQSWEILLLNT